MDNSLPTQSERAYQSNYACTPLWSPALRTRLHGYGDTLRPTPSLSHNISTRCSIFGYDLEPTPTAFYGSYYLDSTLPDSSPVSEMCTPGYDNTLSPLAPSLIQDTATSGSVVKHESEPAPSLVCESSSSDSASICSPVLETRPAPAPRPGRHPTLLPAPSRTKKTSSKVSSTKDIPMEDISTDGSGVGHTSQLMPSPAARPLPIDVVRKTCERCYQLNYKCGGEPHCRRCKSNGVNSCHFCRETKLKCNGVDPCWACKVRGRDCSYPKGSLKVCRKCESLHRISSGGERPLCEQCKTRHKQPAPPVQQNKDAEDTYSNNGTFNRKTEQTPVYLPYASQLLPPQQYVLGVSSDPTVLSNPPLIRPIALSADAPQLFNPGPGSNAGSDTSTFVSPTTNGGTSNTTTTCVTCLPCNLLAGQGFPHRTFASPTLPAMLNQFNPVAAQYSPGCS